MRKRNIDEELKISYTKMALDWCVENLGVNKRKRKKLILEINDKDFSQSRIIYYGKYCFYQNKIVIYISSCETIDDLISTMIHEYTHYLQSSSLYRYLSQLKKVKNCHWFAGSFDEQRYHNPNIFLNRQ